MLEYLVPLIASFIRPDWLELAIYPIFCIYFIGSIPGLLRLFTSWR